MTNIFDKALADLEGVFAGLWSKLEPHVVPELADQAKAVVTEVQQQAKTVTGEAIKMATGDVATVAEVAVKAAMDAMQALGVPYNDVPAEQRPTLPSDNAPAAPAESAAPAAPEPSAVPVDTEIPAPPVTEPAPVESTPVTPQTVQG